MDSTAALELEEIPDRLLVVGGGIIGLEMACVYDALGSTVTMVELLPGLMPGADPDLVKPLERRIRKRYAAIHLETKVSGIDVADDALVVHFEGKHTETESFDRVLVAVGRTPNGGRINAEAAGVAVDERGFIAVDKQMRTNVQHIYAIGDIANPSGRAGARRLRRGFSGHGDRLLLIPVADRLAAGSPAGTQVLDVDTASGDDQTVLLVGRARRGQG